MEKVTRKLTPGKRRIKHVLYFIVYQESRPNREIPLTANALTRKHPLQWLQDLYYTPDAEHRDIQAIILWWTRVSDLHVPDSVKENLLLGE